MKRSKPIAILGGMGPSASVYLYDVLIKQSAQYFGAKNNDDYPEILLHSIPVPDFIADTTNKEKALIMLLDRVRNFNSIEVGNIGIACNTVHILHDKLQIASNAQIISMIDEVVGSVSEAGIKRVGILGNATTLTSQLYQKALAKKGIGSVIPSEEGMNLLEGITRNIIAEKRTEIDRQNLKRLADDLHERSAKGIILGCTELPLIFPKNYDLPVFNSVEILAMSLLRKYYTSHTIGRQHD